MVQELAAFLRSRRKANLTIVMVNVVVFIVLSLLGNTEDAQFMYAHGACWAPAVRDGEYWRLVTSMFLHFGIVHLVYNMLCLIYLGDVLERAVGPVCYLIIYFAGGLAGNVLSVCWETYRGSYAVSAGASGAVFAVIGAIWMIALRNRRQIGGIPAQRIGLMTVLMIAQGFTEAGTDNAAHIGGAAAGFLLALLLCRPQRAQK